MRSYTFVMIKPDIISQSKIGNIITMIENEFFQIKKMKMMYLTVEQATEFYTEHRSKNHFGDLIEFITSGPVVAMILEGDGDVVAQARELIGATNPKEAKFGTIRHSFAASISENAIHGSDSDESATREMDLFRSWM